MDPAHSLRSRHRRLRAGLPFLAALALLTMPVVSDTPPTQAKRPAERVVSLPAPAANGALFVEEALARRLSVRSYASDPLTLNQVSQLLWAAQGGTYRGKRRTAPSAGALYPLELYLAVGAVEGLPAGVYHYRQAAHALERIGDGDLRRPLAAAAVGQEWVARAPAVLVIAAVHRRTAAKYGGRAERYVAMEVGHAGQNVYLQATALGLGTVMVGAFDDARVQDLLDLPADHRPLALMPLGRPR